MSTSREKLWTTVTRDARDDAGRGSGVGGDVEGGGRSRASREHEARSEKAPEPHLLCGSALSLSPLGYSGGVYPGYYRPPAGDIANFSGGTVRVVRRGYCGRLLLSGKGLLNTFYCIRDEELSSIHCVLWVESQIRFVFFSSISLIPSSSPHASLDCAARMPRIDAC